LDVPGLDGFVGSGVYYGAASTEADSCTGEDIYIVGGANSAGQAAVFFSGRARQVHILVRGKSLEHSMSHYLIEQIAAVDTITVHAQTQVVGAEGDGHLERLRLLDSATGETRSVETQHLFVFIGAAPRTEWLDGVIERDANGFVLAGPDLATDGRCPRGWNLERAPYHLETNIPGVFVAGDARAESIKRVASAVGDGAMAVALAHRYLAL
jgi:thioredoxin reductase (NADPH)